MSENKVILITAKKDTAQSYKGKFETMPTIGTVFKDVANFTVVDGDGTFSIYAEIPSDSMNDFQALASEKGYTVDAPHKFKAFGR